MKINELRDEQLRRYEVAFHFGNTSGSTLVPEYPITMASSDLLKEQVDHLIAFVDAHNKVGPERRGLFYLRHPVSNDPRPEILDDGLATGYRAADSDLAELHRTGFIAIDRGGRSITFRVTNNGIRAAHELARGNAASIEAVEAEPQHYIRAQAFASRYSEAHARWLEADKMLRAPQAESHLSTIGHLTREAMQAFAITLCELTSTATPPSLEPAKTVARVRACIDARKPALSEAVAKFVDALVVYWGTVSDLVQRQEHGATKAGPPLSIEDGRRVVFHTAIVMFELDRALVTRPR